MSLTASRNLSGLLLLALTGACSDRAPVKELANDDEPPQSAAAPEREDLASKETTDVDVHEWMLTMRHIEGILVGHELPQSLVGVQLMAMPSSEPGAGYTCSIDGSKWAVDLPGGDCEIVARCWDGGTIGHATYTGDDEGLVELNIGDAYRHTITIEEAGAPGVSQVDLRSELGGELNLSCAPGEMQVILSSDGEPKAYVRSQNCRWSVSPLLPGDNRIRLKERPLVVLDVSELRSTFAGVGELGIALQVTEELADEWGVGRSYWINQRLGSKRESTARGGRIRIVGDNDLIVLPPTPGEYEVLALWLSSEGERAIRVVAEQRQVGSILVPENVDGKTAVQHRVGAW